jgi:hypothetical protein
VDAGDKPFSNTSFKNSSALIFGKGACIAEDINPFSLCNRNDLIDDEIYISIYIALKLIRNYMGC